MKFWVGSIEAFMLIAVISAESALAGDLALDLASAFRQDGQMTEAITEYKRYIYFSSSNQEHDQVYYAMGRTYTSIREWDDALNSFRRSLRHARNDTIRDQISISIAATEICAGNHSGAQVQLLRVMYFGSSSIAQYRSRILLGVSQLYESEYDKARETILQGCDGTDYMGAVATSLESGWKSPQLSKWMSTLLPGVGQIYSGSWLNGVGALAVNALTGLLLYHGVSNDEWLETGTFYLPLWWRYYSGNRYNAERLARAHNSDLARERAALLLNELEMHNEANVQASVTR
jgi:tetratricopeptide (TPR) repeat protein